MFNHVGDPSANSHSYYSEANEQAPTSHDAPYGSTRPSNDQFGSLAPRGNAVSEFGSVVSHELLGDYYAPQYHDPNIYRQWSAGRRPRSEASDGSYATAENQSVHDRSYASSEASSHLPPSPASTSTVSSLHPLSDIDQALSEAGSRRGRLSSHSSGRSDKSDANAASGHTSPELSGLRERLNRLREGITIPSDFPSAAWQPDAQLSADEIHLSTPATAGPPARRPPPLRSQLREEGYPQSNSAAATSAARSSLPPRGRPAVYGRQSVLTRVWNALTSRRSS